MTEVGLVMNGSTSMLVSLALDAASIKHMAAAQNIANANNDGYRPVQVDFDERVALFRDELMNADGATATKAIEALRSGLQVTETPEGEAHKVELDVEVAKMTQNAVHYQALLAAQGKLLSFLRLAIDAGR